MGGTILTAHLLVSAQNSFIALAASVILNGSWNRSGVDSFMQSAVFLIGGKSFGMGKMGADDVWLSENSIVSLSYNSGSLPENAATLVRMIL